jgi:hypothetical protein
MVTRRPARSADIQQMPPHPGDVHWDYFRDADIEVFRTEYRKLYPKNWRDTILGFRFKPRYSWDDMLVYVRSTAHIVDESYWRQLWENYNAFLDQQFNCSHTWMMDTEVNVNSQKLEEYDYISKVCIWCYKVESEHFNHEAKRRTTLTYKQILNQSRPSIIKTLDAIDAAKLAHVDKP